jgi:HEAT repeat protein
VVGGSTLTLIKGAMKIMAWTKAKLAIGVGVGVLLTAGTTVVVVKTVSPSEPSYQGKLLSDWTKDFFQRTAKGYTISSGGEAADAIQHMGKKAIPTLLKMVSSQKPFDNATNSFAFQQQAAGGFWALGPVAESAIPELAKFVNQPKHAPGAAKSLAGISPKAVEPLIRALNNTNANVRVFVASALGQGFEPPHADPNISISPRTPPLGSDVTATIAALIQCTKDTDKTVRAVASSALGKIGKEPEIVIPVLIEMLSDDEREGRRMAAQSLGFFGKEARVAIPSLTTATNDSDSNVQRLAQQALKRIEIGVSYQSPAFK